MSIAVFTLNTGTISEIIVGIVTQYANAAVGLRDLRQAIERIELIGCMRKRRVDRGLIGVAVVAVGGRETVLSCWDPTVCRSRHGPPESNRLGPL